MTNITNIKKWVEALKDGDWYVRLKAYEHLKIGNYYGK